MSLKLFSSLGRLLSLLENEVLRRIYGLEIDEVTGE
jgi:hypothetical protein